MSSPSAWAFGADDATAIAKRNIHLLRIGGSARSTYETHGYADALRTVVEHGIFDFVGSPVASSHLLHSRADDGLEERIADTVNAIVHDVLSCQRTLVAA